MRCQRIGTTSKTRRRDRSLRSVQQEAWFTPHTILLAELFEIVRDPIREIEAMMLNVPLGATSSWHRTA